MKRAERNLIMLIVPVVTIAVGVLLGLVTFEFGHAFSDLEPWRAAVAAGGVSLSWCFWVGSVMNAYQLLRRLR